MSLRTFTVYDSLERSALLYGSRTAVVESDRRLTYAQFKDEADRLAEGFVRSGVCKGDRIALLAQNSAAYLCLYPAAARVGAILVPINWRFKPEEIDYILNDTTPVMFIAGREFLETAASAGAGKPFIKSRFCLEGEAEEFEDFANLLGEESRTPPASMDEGDGFVIIHTAAMGGKPRGALLSHGNFIAANLSWIGAMCLTQLDVHLNALPLYHIADLAIASAMIHSGGANVILPKFDAAAALEMIEKEQVTVFFSFPPVVSMLLESLKTRPRDVSSVRYVGGLESAEVIAEFEKVFRAEFWVGYGQTETTGFATFCPSEERPGSAGKPGPLTILNIVDDDDRAVPTGEDGEIVISGPMVFDGYWNLEAETDRAFRSDMHHTGDVGRLDAEGYLFYVKRKPEKELIKPGGENVYPAEVENVTLQHPEVMECLVIGVPDKEWGEAIKAVCILEPGSTLSEKDLIDFVASRIARYKKPKYVVFVDDLPRVKDGAVDREAVKKAHGGLY